MANASDLTSLPPQGRQALMDLLNERSRTDPKAGMRKSRRYAAYALRDAVATLGESSQVRQAQVIVVDLSAGGISFLHGVFTHPGTRCMMTIQTVDGERVRIPGTIVRCTHVTGRVHEHGVKFADLINPALFVAEAASDAGWSSGPLPDWARVDELARDLDRAVRMRDPGAVNAAVDALAAAMNALAQV